MIAKRMVGQDIAALDFLEDCVIPEARAEKRRLTKNTDGIDAVEAEELADILGGEVEFGSGGLKLYRADVEYLERVRGR